MTTLSALQSTEISKLPALGFADAIAIIPDVLTDVRYYATYNFVGTRIDGYEAPRILLTCEAAKALRAVSDEIVSKGYRLKLYDGYRPQTAVDHFIRWAEDIHDTAMKPYFYPETDKSVLFAQGYIATRSSHSRGSTVDLTLFDMTTGCDADMGGTFDFFDPCSCPGYALLTPQQRDNRELLRNAMLCHGFTQYPLEWWHFTLSDEPYPDTYFSFPITAGFPACMF